MTLQVLTFNLAMLAAVGGALSALSRRLQGRGMVAPGGLLLGAVAVALFPLGAVDAFGVMQLAAWALFVHVPLFLAGAAVILRARSVAGSTVAVVVALAVAGVGVDAFFVEPRWLEVTHVTVETDKLERRVRVGIVSDLQTDAPGDFERDVLRRLMEASPDLILFTGDYLQVPRGDHAERARSLNAIFHEVGLSAPLGVYAVQGNTDFPDLWPSVFAGLPVEAIGRTASFDIDALRLTGLSFNDSFDLRTRVAPFDGFQIVFGHAPDFSLGRVEADLLIAGHTHGGQVRLPWFGPLITFSQVPRDWAAGVTRLDGGRTLVVSRGIGMERGQAPRLRFLCRPELVFVEIEPRGRFPNPRIWDTFPGAR